MKTILKRTTEITPTAEEAGECFANFDNEEQAKFFNKIAECVKTWKTKYNGEEHPGHFCFQMQAIIDTGLLTDEAKSIMKDIGGYATDLI